MTQLITEAYVDDVRRNPKRINYDAMMVTPTHWRIIVAFGMSLYDPSTSRGQEARRDFQEYWSGKLKGRTSLEGLFNGAKSEGVDHDCISHMRKVKKRISSDSDLAEAWQHLQHNNAFKVLGMIDRRAQLDTLDMLPK
ncbi:MAG: hypothetical protein ACRBCT_06095 [Alphaproteobacteria bacterium]